MAVYLASLKGEAVAQVQVATTLPNPNGRRVFEGACKACHADGLGPTLFGVSPSLATNTNVHSDQPDNLIKVILQGISNPATEDLGYMPGFKDSLSNSQVADLVAYLRGRFAPNAPTWNGLEQKVAHLRANPGTH
jgi:nicotinate dehydrogenase subunit B